MPGSSLAAAPGRRARRRGAAAVLLAALASGFAAVPAAPAHAVDIRCSKEQSKTFATPGTDTRVFSVRNCMELRGGLVQARTHIVWEGGGPPKKFDHFEIATGVQRNDEIHLQENCIISRINKDWQGTATCQTDWYNPTAGGYWTGDGFIAYNLDKDGDGLFTWQLAGSPAFW